VITGAHAIIFTSEPDAARAFLRDVLGFPSVDAGGGWLIFELPPAELAVHPAEGANRHELYLMCDDIDETVTSLRAKSAEFIGDIEDARFGRVATMRIPGGALRIYQPRHASPLFDGLRPTSAEQQDADPD
jgi:catechol 2,3-dioxygenase-like lactoylglutathione lyase family enzyme